MKFWYMLPHGWTLKSWLLNKPIIGTQVYNSISRRHRYLYIHRNGRRNSSCLDVGIRSRMVTMFWRQTLMTGGGWHWWKSCAHKCWDRGLVGFICTTTIKVPRMRMLLCGRQLALVPVRPWVWCDKKKTTRFFWYKTGFKTSTWMF